MNKHTYTQVLLLLHYIFILYIINDNIISINTNISITGRAGELRPRAGVRHLLLRGQNKQT